MLSFQASKVSDCGATVKPPVHNESDFTPFSHTVEDPDFLFDGQQTAANYDSTAFVSSILSDQFPSAIINLDDLNLDQVKQLHSHFKLVKQNGSQKMKRAINIKMFDKYVSLVDVQDVTDVFLPLYALEKQTEKVRRFGQLKGHFKKQPLDGQTEMLQTVHQHILSKAGNKG